MRLEGITAQGMLDLGFTLRRHVREVAPAPQRPVVQLDLRPLANSLQMIGGTIKLVAETLRNPAQSAADEQYRLGAIAFSHGWTEDADQHLRSSRELPIPGCTPLVARLARPRPGGYLGCRVASNQRSSILR